MTIKRSWHKKKIGPGSVLRRVGYSDKMPSVAQSRVLQAWRLKRERREQTMDTYTLELVGSALSPWCWCPGSGCHWGHWRCLGSMAGLAGARSPRPRHWLSSASLHWLTASNGRGRALAECWGLRRVSWVATRGSIFPGQGHGQAACLTAASFLRRPSLHRNQRSQAVTGCGLHRGIWANVTQSHVGENCLHYDGYKLVKSLCVLSLSSDITLWLHFIFE